MCREFYAAMAEAWSRNINYGISLPSFAVEGFINKHQHEEFLGNDTTVCNLGILYKHMLPDRFDIETGDPKLDVPLKVLESSSGVPFEANQGRSKPSWRLDSLPRGTLW